MERIMYKELELLIYNCRNMLLNRAMRFELCFRVICVYIPRHRWPWSLEPWTLISGWDARSSQDIMHSQHSQSTTYWHVFGRKPIETEAENAQRLHTDSNMTTRLNWEPWRCEVATLPAALSSCPWSQLINSFLLPFSNFPRSIITKCWI